MELYHDISRMVSGRPEKGAAVAAAEYLRGAYPDTAGLSPRSLRLKSDVADNPLPFQQMQLPRGGPSQPAEYAPHLLMDYTDHPGDVADPWYTDDFETTWRDVLEGCKGLLEQLEGS